jgi:hypothetical protein
MRFGRMRAGHTFPHRTQRSTKHAYVVGANVTSREVRLIEAHTERPPTSKRTKGGAAQKFLSRTEGTNLCSIAN